MTEPNKFPVWNKEKPDESLDSIYGWAVELAVGYSQWYDRKKKPSKIWSKSLRFFAIMFAAAGALCPLLDATGIFSNSAELQNRLVLAQWGYVFLALAASIAGFDYYFGHSSGWMRFIVTQISIDRALKEFQYDWALLKARQGNAAGNTLLFLQRAKDFTLQIENIVKQETDAWVTEFRSNISQLEKVLKTEIETRKPGSIRVVVKNCAAFERVVIRLNNDPVKELVGVTEGIINTVSPGQYEVAVSGRKDGQESKANQIIEVQAGATATAEFTLPDSSHH